MLQPFILFSRIQVVSIVFSAPSALLSFVQYTLFKRKFSIFTAFRFEALNYFDLSFNLKLSLSKTLQIVDANDEYMQMVLYFV